jgi:hypothetical protein
VVLPITLTSPDFEAGVDLAQLSSDWTGLTGKPFPVAQP